MKCFALGLSTASLVLLVALKGAAQTAAPPPKAPETAPPTPAPATTEAPAPPPQAPPTVATPNPTAPSPLAPSPPPTANPSPMPTPTSPYAPYAYPPYGYRNPYGGFGWGMPEEPPKEMAYNGGGIPRGYKLDERYNIGLLIAGPTLFALGYAVAIYTASEENDEPPQVGGSTRTTTPWSALYIPITGPFAFSPYAPRGSSFIYIFEGLAQVCGVGLFLGGILRPKEILVRQNTLEAFRPTLRVGPGAMQVEMKF